MPELKGSEYSDDDEENELTMEEIDLEELDKVPRRVEEDESFTVKTITRAFKSGKFQNSWLLHAVDKDGKNISFWVTASLLPKMKRILDAGNIAEFSARPSGKFAQRTIAAIQVPTGKTGRKK